MFIAAVHSQDSFSRRDLTILHGELLDGFAHLLALHLADIQRVRILGGLDGDIRYALVHGVGTVARPVARKKWLRTHMRQNGGVATTWAELAKFEPLLLPSE